MVCFFVKHVHLKFDYITDGSEVAGRCLRNWQWIACVAMLETRSCNSVHLRRFGKNIFSDVNS